jgi:hypothetical protein
MMASSNVDEKQEEPDFVVDNDPVQGDMIPARKVEYNPKNPSPFVKAKI